MTIQELAAQYGWIGAILLYAIVEAIKAGIRAANAGVSRVETETKQDDALTNFSIEFNAERKQLQESNNRLQAELIQVQLSQAKEEGRREELRLAIASQDDKSRKMEARILELEKHQQINQARIVELENQIAELEKKLASANVEIDILQAQKRELEVQLEQERNRADTLSNLVTQLQAIDSPPKAPTDSTQPLPDISVDDTEYPILPLAVDNEPTNNEPPLSSAA